MPSVDELVEGLDHTWRAIADCLERWIPAKMGQAASGERGAEKVRPSRAEAV